MTAIGQWLPPPIRNLVFPVGKERQSGYISRPVLHEQPFILMFTKKELNEYEEDFRTLGITDPDTMLGILNTLDELAEITYYIEKQEEL